MKVIQVIVPPRFIRRHLALEFAWKSSATHMRSLFSRVYYLHCIARYLKNAHELRWFKWLLCTVDWIGKMVQHALSCANCALQWNWVSPWNEPKLCYIFTTVGYLLFPLLCPTAFCSSHNLLHVVFTHFSSWVTQFSVCGSPHTLQNTALCLNSSHSALICPISYDGITQGIVSSLIMVSSLIKYMKKKIVTVIFDIPLVSRRFR